MKRLRWIALIVIALAGAFIFDPRHSIQRVLLPKTLLNTLLNTEVERNYLTNLPGSNSPILAVKVDDTPPAHPQLGLDVADVIYIEQVEGGLTRLAAIYSDRLPSSIEPVRSARISDIDILAQFGHVGFAFSGVQTKFRPVLDAANVENLSAERYPPSIYSRDLSRSEPTNMVLNPKKLLDLALNSEHKSIASLTTPMWHHGDAPIHGSPLLSAKVTWPASSYTFRWSSESRSWEVQYLDKPDLNEKGRALTTPNVIIQKVSITPSEYHDKVGGITPLSQTVGSGTGYLLRDGQEFPISWNRSNQLSSTQWFLVDGTPANLADGQLWIALTDSDPVFVRPETAKVRPSQPSK
jgi:Protein of unknown function (DUF3048) N-terminal domain/Protein of unknown function (DUF3048) C-terminal domain